MFLSTVKQNNKLYSNFERKNLNTIKNLKELHGYNTNKSETIEAKKMNFNINKNRVISTVDSNTYYRAIGLL